MKKLIFILLSVLVFVSCETTSDVKEDIEVLKQKRKDLTIANDGYRLSNKLLEEHNAKLMTDTKVLRALQQGKQPRFVLKLELKQSRFDFDITKHIKDEMNAVVFEIPVDREFFDSAKVGGSLVDAFREGSMLMEGSFSKWKVTIIEKRIVL